MADKKPADSKKNGSNLFLRFSGLAFQMGILIGLGAWGGTELDESYQNEKPVFTIILCLAAIAISLYLVIREASKLSKDD
jgi:ATP synthase protein I